MGKEYYFHAADHKEHRKHLFAKEEATLITNSLVSMAGGEEGDGERTPSHSLHSEYSQSVSGSKESTTSDSLSQVSSVLDEHEHIEGKSKDVEKHQAENKEKKRKTRRAAREIPRQNKRRPATCHPQALAEKPPSARNCWTLLTQKRNMMAQAPTPRRRMKLRGSVPSTTSPLGIGMF